MSKWIATRDAATVLAGRILVSAIFLQSAATKTLNWQGALDEIASYGLPRSAALLAPTIVAHFIGGVGLLLGALTRLCAAMLLVFMIPATFFIHGFYRYTGAAYDHQFMGFFQNLTMSGGLVLLLSTGAGALSVDALRASRGRRA